MSSPPVFRCPGSLPAMLWTVLCLVFLVLFSCVEDGSGDSGQTGIERDDPVRIVYVDWASEKASAHVVKAVLENRMGRECRLLEVTLIAMWEALAAGDQDASVAAWLPSLHARFLEKHGSKVVNLGPNLEGTRIGLVVPAYVPVDSIDELTEHAERFKGRIIGIDPHAGIMDRTKQVLDAYGMHAFDLVSGSGSTMTSALGQAIRKREWIAVTGWFPHWKFDKWDLKYLKDPRNVYGGGERICTIVRKGLREDMPRVYAFLDSFSWSPGEMREVMRKARINGSSYAEAATEWVEKNECRVEAWLEQ